jgi:pimeloyl-ACP methyl ester carboxylesterase
VATSPNTSGPVERAVLAGLAGLAPTFRERFVSAGSGVLRVLEGGSGPPLVLVHGRGSAAVAWFPLLPHLARTHRVLAVDLPGFGASRGHRFAGGGSEGAIAFFVDPVEAWLAAEGIAAPVIVGHSLGGLVALELALRGRVKPAGLGLIASMGIGPEVTYPARAFFRLGPERVARAIGPGAFAKLLASRGPDAARLDALAYELYAIPEGRADAAAAFNALVPLVGPAPHRRARLHTIDVPALVYWGDADEALPSPLAIAAAAELPRSTLHLVPGGHSPHAEAPATALGILDSFLSSVIT